LTILYLIGASLLFGQLDSDTVTIQTSRSITLTPDQAAFYVAVGASPATSLDQIVAALAPTGINASNFTSMNSDNRSLQWSFRLAVPFTKTTGTIASLIALQQSIGQNNSGMSLMFQIQGTQVSAQAIQSHTCAAKDLVADAQAQAQNVAAAAGLYIGPILAISDGSSIPAAQGYFGITSVYAVQASWVNPFLGYPTTPSGCYLEVKFKLLRYQ
jgi:hypothetical protein